MRVTVGPVAALMVLVGGSLAAQDVELDTSACQGMYTVLATMRAGASREATQALLDALLETPPYEVMFRHYNRPWRPTHLPKAVFRRMVLSIAFPDEYAPGENQRADEMRRLWLEAYADLDSYERRLRQLERADLDSAVRQGVRSAQGWLPGGWTIPGFRLWVVPNGGSSAFTIDGDQGYDFLQLELTSGGDLDVAAFVATVAHESHHLGMRLQPPPGLSRADTMAWHVVTLCLAEGAATAFVTGTPGGRAPAVSDVPARMGEGSRRAWEERVEEEEEMVAKLAGLLDRAVSGTLARDEFDRELREYWLNGLLGRAYVLGAEMLSAIHLAFGRQGVFAVLEEPRRFLEKYNAALDAEPRRLARCIRMPAKAVGQALSIGHAGSP